MNCREIQELSSDYLDRRLTPSETALFREHLKVCPDCRGEVEELRKTVALVGSLDEIETGPDFLVRVNNKIDRGGWLRRFSRRLFAPWRIKIPLEAAALVAVTTLALYVYHRTPELPQYKAHLSQDSAKTPRAELTQQQRVGDAQDLIGKYLPVPEADKGKRTEQHSEAPSSAAPAKEAARPQVAPGLTISKPPAAPREVAAGAQGTVTQAESAARGVREEKSTGGQVAEQRQRMVQGAMSSPSPKRVEVSSEDAGLLSDRIKALVPDLGGKVLGERALDDGVDLAIELPQSREVEFRSALQAETRAERADAAAGLKSAEAPPPLQGQAQNDAPMLQRTGRQVEKFALKGEDPAVIIELRIRQQK
jgi:hypothetical protein